MSIFSSMWNGSRTLFSKLNGNVPERKLGLAAESRSWEIVVSASGARTKSPPEIKQVTR